MQFRDLKTQYKIMKAQMDTAICQVLEEGSYISGRQVRELEEKLAEYVGVKHCITCGNGTDALTLMMMVWNITAGDAVFVPDFTFFASGEIVAYAGAVPVFYDVSEQTFNGDANSLEQAILAVQKEGKLKPRAVIAVDLFGQPAEYQRICAVAKKYGLLVLEDGAQGFGGSIGAQKACSFGDAATTSFFPAKPLGCYGDGGAVFVNDGEIAERIKSFRVHGMGKSKYDNIRVGINSRLDTLQAAVLLVKLQAFRDYELEKIHRIAEFYTDSLKGYVKTPYILPGYTSSWAQYAIQLPDSVDRAYVQKYLLAKGIPTMVYYQKPMHQQQAFALCKQYTDCPITEALCQCVLEIPISPYMELEEAEQVVTALKEACS